MTLQQAFHSGNPAKAWQHTQQLLGVARKLVDEAAQARFKVNLGTEACESCEGLRAGEGVTATCYQLKRCYYGNVRQGELSSKQRSIIEGLTAGPRRALAKRSDRS